MNFAQKMTLYHQELAKLRWKTDLFALDEAFWRKLQTSRPKKATPLFQEHLDRVQGRSSPQACDDKLAELIKR